VGVPRPFGRRQADECRLPPFKVWYRLLKSAGVRRVRLHDLRHTYASLLLLAGEPMLYVKEQLGHSTVQVTVDLYGHVRPGLNRGAVNRLAEATRPGSPGHATTL